ncbi:Origin recognition complex subunit 2 [Malassezia caprae]|uniref:Origin recognition complex subunit 2 n=1 Tax=Malassezia caprae TaxID=1381934 RepID=A0AAF0EAD6_9BASI|nr:Origin recognition complex subunit 2 [Malassezia caprae]
MSPEPEDAAGTAAPSSTPLDDGDVPSDSEVPLSEVTSSPRRPAPAFTHTSFVRATSSDAWLLSNSHRRNFASRKLGRDIFRISSTKRISQRLGALDVSVLPHIAHLAAESSGPPLHPARTAHSKQMLAFQLREDRLDTMLAQLLGGFHIVLYGVGDRMPVMRALMERGAQHHCGAAVIVQGAAGRGVQVDRILESIEQAIGLEDSDAQDAPRRLERPSRVMQRVQRITRYLSEPGASARPQHAFLGFLAFDQAIFHTLRLHTLVHALARSPRIHLVASVSHVNAGLLLDGPTGSFGWGMAGHPPPTDQAEPGGRTLRAPWLWYNATTFVPPIAELVQARSTTTGMPILTGLAGMKLPAAVDLAGGRGRAAPNASAAVAMAQPISETSAVQVLSTITARARSLFAQLAALQLMAVDNEATIPRTPYASLVREALREFVASSDEGVRQLLGEMVDHGLVVVSRGQTTVTNSHAIAVGDELSIPLPVPMLEQVLAQIA